MATEPAGEEKPRSYATNEEMTTITGVTRDTLYKWVRDKLLPKPKITSDGRGTRSLWSLEAVERARFIVERRAEFHTMQEIQEMVLERWPPPPKPARPGKDR